MSINLIANSFGLINLKSGDEIIITVAEHHANIIPWQILCERTGARIVAVPVDSDGVFHLSELKKRVTKTIELLFFIRFLFIFYHILSHLFIAIIITIYTYRQLHP